MKVKFEFPLTLQTSYPGEVGEVHIFYNGEAEFLAYDMDGHEVETVEVLNVFQGLAGHEQQSLKIPKGLEAQEAAQKDMRRFLGLCRDAVRKALPSIETGGVQHNGGFVPNPTDTRYMNEE